MMTNPAANLPTTEEKKTYAIISVYDNAIAGWVCYLCGTGMLESIQVCGLRFCYCDCEGAQYVGKLKGLEPC